jgi:hypothetical protein
MMLGIEADLHLLAADSLAHWRAVLVLEADLGEDMHDLQGVGKCSAEEEQPDPQESHSQIRKARETS